MRRRLTAVATPVALVALVGGGCSLGVTSRPTAEPSASATSVFTSLSPRPTTVTSPTGSPTSVGASPVTRVRPRRDLTPGALNPDVTQETIYSTICVVGWTKTVRPPTSYTGPLKQRQIAQYGYADTDPGHYEEDHLIPLELGGAPRDPANLWPEPGASPNPKDADENRLHADVCAGRRTLADARAALLATWGPLS